MKRVRIMKHRKLLVGSVIAIPIGLVLWIIIRTAITLAGIAALQEGLWIFSQTVIELTTTHWVGLAICILGLIIVIAGTSEIIIAFVLEILDKGKKLRRLKHKRPTYLNH